MSILNNSLILGVMTFLSLTGHAHDHAHEKIKPGEYIDNLYPQQISEPYLLRQLTDKSYWASVHGYSALFYVGEEGVMLVDPLGPGAGEGLLAAIKSVTDLPITALVYSHYHLDHIGDAPLIINTNKNMKIYASETTAEHAEFYKHVPLPTEVIAEPRGQFTFEDVVVEMYTPEQGHSDDDSIIFIPSEKVVHFVDMINPGQMPYLNFAGVQDFNAYQDNLRYLLTLDWTLMNAGHANVGSKKDVEFVLNYIEELKIAISGTFGKIKPITYHDPAYNHQRAVQRYQAAVTKAIREPFEKKYGHYYGFNDAFPTQVGVVLSHLQLYGK
ncbi:MAG TPA: MBL fold metallo-hydrolase [Gammaproteobacteria bacterium]|nr:MBL fold metallo-hydrolase [Gammaproteobacteria bacterium]